MQRNVEFQTDGNTGRLRAWLFPVLLFGGIGAAICLVLIAEHGVSIPYWDDWKLVEFVHRFRLNPGNPGLFWALHNESRPVVGRLIFAALSSIQGVTTVSFCMLSVLFALATLALLSRAATGIFAARWKIWVFVAFCAAFLFSPLQWENWLWAHQFQLFLGNLLAIAALYSASVGDLPERKIGIPIALAALASLTFASGLALWLLIALGLVFRLRGGGISKKSQLTFVISGATFMALYFYQFKGKSYETVAGASPPGLVDFARFFLAWIGSPFVGGDDPKLVTPAIIAGMAVVVTSLSVVFVQFRMKIYRSPGAVFCSLLILYSFANALMVTIGRLPLGVECALKSRYVTFSIFAPIGICGLLLLVTKDEVRGKGRAVAVVPAIGMFLVAFGFSIHAGFESLENWKVTQDRRGFTRTYIRFIMSHSGAYSQFVCDEGDVGLVRNEALYCSNENLLGVRVSSPSELAARVKNAVSVAPALGVSEFEPRGDSVVITGIAINPQTIDPSDGILVLKVDEGGLCTVLSIPALRFEVPIQLANMDLFKTRSGWQTLFSKSLMPGPGEKLLVLADNGFEEAMTILPIRGLQVSK